MTLVVTEVSTLGIVIMGDTACTRTIGGLPVRESGHLKVYYIPNANVGMAAWGRAKVRGQMLDDWLVQFTKTHVSAGSGPREVADQLKESLNVELRATGLTWAQLGRRGIHVAGYEGEFPVLLHVHNGSEMEPTQPLTVEDTLKLYAAYENGGPAFFFTSRGVHLRNGVYRPFADLWEKDQELSLGEVKDQTLNERVEHYRPLFRGVAADHQEVDDAFCVVAFTRAGIVVDDRSAATRAATLGSSAGGTWTELETPEFSAIAA